MQNALLHDGLRFWAMTQPDRLALVFDAEQELSYGELYRWSGAAAAHLAACGVQPGDRVGILGGNCIEWVVWAFATLRAGATILPLNDRFTAAELGYLVDSTTPTVIIADPDHMPVIAPVAGAATCIALESAGDLRHAPAGDWREPRVGSDSIAQIIFTSGTTGRPKGVMISHGQLLGKYFEVRLMLPDFGGPDVRQLMMVSLHSGPGTTWGYLFTTSNGGLFCFTRRFDPELALRILVERQISLMTSFPLMLQRISDVPGFASAELALRVAIAGGAQVPADMLTTWRRKGVLLRQLYGLTEGGNILTISSDREVLEDRQSCGRPLQFTRIRIVRGDGSECAAGEAGEIQVQGVGMMVGYWNDPQATAAAFADGWLQTGDRGFLDADGYLTFVDRQKDMIITGGFNVSPSEIEQVIARFAGVAEVAVIAVPHEKFGETPAACIHATAAVDPEQLFQHCKAQLAGFKLPRYLILHDGPLPRTNSSKIDKTQLVAAYRDAAARFRYFR